jgi:DNA-binding MarR family transcriptional regulator
LLLKNRTDIFVLEHFASRIIMTVKNSLGRITHLIHRLSQHADDSFARSVDPIGITPRQLSVLSTVAELESPSQVKLVEKTGIDRSTMADIVRRLVKRGWLSRRRTRIDARAYAISVTTEGQRLLDHVLPIAAASDAALVVDLTTEEQERFTVLLQKIVAQPGSLSRSDDDHKPDTEPQIDLPG